MHLTIISYMLLTYLAILSELLKQCTLKRLRKVIWKVHKEEHQAHSITDTPPYITVDMILLQLFNLCCVFDPQN